MIAGNLDQYARYHQILEQISKIQTAICKSFGKDKKAVTDPLSEAKICFDFICFLIEPYFKKFQADNPVGSFIYTELKSSLRNLPSFYLVKPDVLNKFKTGLQMALIDLDPKKICTFYLVKPDVLNKFKTGLQMALIDLDPKKICCI